MPTSQEHDIIDLTEVVEEGHPDRPNLQSAKPAAQPESEEGLGDMDLEMEIDQIFSDLGPSRAAAGSDAEDKQATSSSDEDTLDLDELFAAEKPSAAKAGARSKAKDVPNDAPSQADQGDVMDLGDGFDDLFADLEKSSAPPAGKDEPETASETASDQEMKAKSEDISAEIQDQLPEDGGEDVSEPVPEEKADAGSDEISVQSADKITGEMTDQISDEIFEESPDVSPEARPDESPEESTGEMPAKAPRMASSKTPEPAPDEISGGASGEEADEEADDLHFPAEEDMADAPPAAAKDQDEDQAREKSQEKAADADVIRKLQARINSLEERLAEVAAEKAPTSPDMDELLRQVDERIANAPALAQLGEGQAGAKAELEAGLQALEEKSSQGLRDLEAKVAEAAEKASAGPDMDELLQQVDERIANAPALAQLGEGQDGLKADLKEQAEKASQGLRDLEAKVAEAAEKASASPDVDELLQQVDERIANAPALSAMAEEQAKAVQKQQEATNARLEKIEERLNNFFEHLSRLKEGMEQIVGTVVDGRLESMTAAQEKQLADLRSQILEESESRLKDALQEAAQTSAGHLDARIAEALATNQPDPAEMTAKLEQLREDLLQELQTAVPEAAARIIREEIQALSQDES